MVSQNLLHVIVFPRTQSLKFQDRSRTFHVFQYLQRLWSSELNSSLSCFQAEQKIRFLVTDQPYICKYISDGQWVTDVSRTITFPDRPFPDNHFLGQDISPKDVSRTTACPDSSLISRTRRFPDNHFPGQTFPGQFI